MKSIIESIKVEQTRLNFILAAARRLQSIRALREMLEGVGKGKCRDVVLLIEFTGHDQADAWHSCEKVSCFIAEGGPAETKRLDADLARRRDMETLVGEMTASVRMVFCVMLAEEEAALVKLMRSTPALEIKIEGNL